MPLMGRLYEASAFVTENNNKRQGCLMLQLAERQWMTQKEN